MTRKTMCDPDYVYTPMAPEVRQRLSDAHRARLGIPPGFRRLYGVLVPDALFPEAKRLAAQYRRETADPDLLRYFVRMIVGRLEAGLPVGLR